MQKASQKKGIFSIEGLWNRDLRDPLTVAPALELLKLYDFIPYIHRVCATSAELQYSLTQWTLKRYMQYPILYIVSHGEEYGIDIPEGFVSLDQIAEILEDRCSNKIIIISSCSTLAINKRYIKRFLKQTGALAIGGYRSDVDWIRSAAFEILFLYEMQRNEFSGHGIDAIMRKIRNISKSFTDLKFSMVTIKDL